MANRLEILIEAEKRGLITPRNQEILTEARKRGLAPQPAPQVPIRMGDEGQNITTEDTIAQAKLRQATGEAWKEQRGIGERAADAAAFAGSVIPRTLTRGQYGLGDVVGLASESAGKSIAAGERDFAQANQGALEAIAAAGEASAGIPFLNTMGAPARGMGATARMAAASPRGAIANVIEDTKLGLTAAGQKLTSAAQTAMTPKARPQAPAQAGQPPANIQSLPDRLRDMQAFRELEMDPFAPAMASKGTARMVRTIEEQPIVGGTVKAPKERVGTQLEGAVEGVGRSLGASADEAAMGATTQRGLDRFRTSQLQDLPEGDVAAMGINPNRPAATGRRGNVQIDPDRLNTGLMTEDQLKAAAKAQVDLPGSTRTTVEDLSNAELGTVIKAPSRSTSFATKASALYERAWRRIPTRMRRDNSRNPDAVPTRNAANVVRGILRMEEGAEISGGALTGRFGRLAPALQNLHRNFTIENLRHARAAIGRALAEHGTYETSLSRSQLMQMYGAVTRDLEAGLVAIAARARRASRQNPTRPDGTPDPTYVTPQAADAADRALRSFRQADKYYRASIERMNRVMNVLGANNINEAARMIIRRMRERTQDVGMIRELVRSLKPEEWNSIRGYIFQNLGRGRAGAREAEAGFNFSHWATDWNQLMGTAQKPTAARAMLLDGLPPEVARRLDNIVRVVERMKYYETTRNFSGSAYAGASMLALMSPSVMATAAAFFGGSAIMGKLLTSRAYTAWLESFMQAQMRMGNTAAANARITAQHARRLSAVAARQSDPELARAMQSFALAISQSQNQERITP